MAFSSHLRAASDAIDDQTGVIESLANRLRILRPVEPAAT
jgi:hypothetical protein